MGQHGRWSNMSTARYNFRELTNGTRVQGVIQVKATTLTTPFTTTANINAGGAAITGLSVDITPRFINSSFLVFGYVSAAGTSTGSQVYMRLRRNTTEIGNGVPVSNRPGVVNRAYAEFVTVMTPMSFSILDAPATLSPLTYQVYIGPSNSSTVYVNRTENDSDTAGGNGHRSASNIVVMEIAA